MNDYLTKPVNPEEVFKILSWLRGRKPCSHLFHGISESLSLLFINHVIKQSSTGL